jgi:hypothetical protein
MRGFCRQRSYFDVHTSTLMVPAKAGGTLALRVGIEVFAF